MRVVFHTVTGNTKKVAEAIAGELGCKAEPADAAGTAADLELLVIGASIHGGIIHKSMQDYISRLDPQKIKRAALFSTGFGGKALSIMKSMLRNKGIKTASELFLCRGKFLFFNMGHPDSKDLDEAKEFARKIRT